MRIVIVEHATPALRLLAWGLQEEGFVVETCVLDGVADCIAADPEPPVAAIVNAVMDDDAKQSCVRTLRAAAPGVLIMDLCAHPGDGCEADGHIGAPFRLSDVISTLKATPAG